jgi:transposase
MDEARTGQKGRLTHVRYRRGMRPRGVRQQGFSSAHLLGAVRPERGEAVALVLPEVSAAVMDVFLAEPSRAVPAGTHVALVLDGAGRHVSDGLAVPANPTLIHPPPYSPELNPVELISKYLRRRPPGRGGRGLRDLECPSGRARTPAFAHQFPLVAHVHHHFVGPV